jgi:tetratricopeptide (TPR) repeat protein
MILKTSMNKALQTISAREFAGRLAGGVRVSQQSFTWFFGAGCSKTSGILDAAGLVEKWLREQYDLEANPTKAFDAWTRTNFASYDPANPAKHYAQAFARRHPSPVERQREIEMICSRGEPAYGYATFAQLLSHKDYGRYCNTVLTTNFDDLIADALYLYGERYARPLVVTHEALARYVRTNSPRPTVVKLHGDAHIDPKNLQPETRQIDIALAKQLYPFLQDHALIFVGYGGNDQSILKFVQDCPVPALAPPIFWVSKQEAPAPFHNWLCNREALRVDHTDFDQLMHLIRNALNIELIDRKRWSQIGDGYYEAFGKLREEIEKIGGRSEDTLALQVATSAAEKTLPDDWNYVRQAKDLIESNPNEADKIYREGIQHFPDSRKLHFDYADFLEDRNDADGAETHYRRATELAPRDVLTLTAYARFSFRVRRDLDTAEVYYKRALDLEPSDVFSNVSYANFLREIRGDIDGAELHLRRAIDAHPMDDYALTEYALLLQRDRKDMDSAENYFKRAIDANPHYGYALSQYALFLQHVRKDMDAAEVYFKRGVEADPKSEFNRVSYETFLTERTKINSKE